MMPIDMTAELSVIVVGMNVLLAIATAAILGTIGISAAPARFEKRSTSAVAGPSHSAPAPADAAPSDTSVPEAA